VDCVSLRGLLGYLGDTSGIFQDIRAIQKRGIEDHHRMGLRPGTVYDQINQSINL
jgi:hypothetical protein